MSRPVAHCPTCAGDGYFVYLGGPGCFSERHGTWLPDEHAVACPACTGSGLALDVEVMADRYEELRLLASTTLTPPPYRREDEPEEELPF